MASGKKAVEKKEAHMKAGHVKAQAGHGKGHSEKGEGHAKHAVKKEKESHAKHVKQESRSLHAGHAVEHAKAEEHAVHGHEAVHAKEGAKPAEKAHVEKVSGKQGKAAKKAVEKKAPVKVSKSKEVKRLSRLVVAKKRPMFRGRFGQRAVRSVGDAKWQRWRKPRGIDIYFRREDGLVPGTGYQRPKEIRFVHPSGYRERLVCNMAQLLALEKEKAMVAARISGKIGKRKKELLLNKADELKIAVLNR